MDLLAALAAAPRVHTGRGSNHEGETFVGRLEIEPLVNRSAVMLHYTATGLDGRHLHREATLLGRDHRGGWCLWPVMEELPVVMPHPQVGSSTDADGTVAFVFASGPRDATEVFREEIVLTLYADGRIGIAHRWGMPQGEFGERSRCVLSPALP